MFTVDVIKPQQFKSFVEKTSLGNFMQYPAWAEVKNNWSHDLLGWFSESKEMVGSALILYRKMPYLNKYLAYIPRGPLIDWESNNVGEWLKPLLTYLKKKNVFTVTMDPPVVNAKWTTPTIKNYLQEIKEQQLSNQTLRNIPPDQTFPRAKLVQEQLNKLGWQKNSGDTEFSSVQPEYVFRLPLRGRSLEEVYAGFHTNWRRNVKKADRLGVRVRVGTVDDLPSFYNLLLTTAERDHFRVRSLTYFQQMYNSLQAEDPSRIRLYLAEDDEELLAATLTVYSNAHTWYLYGASSNNKREKAPNHAIQWKMIQDAHEMGADVYDFRGISSTLDEQDHLFGLLRFKLGFGGEACEMIGAWDFAVNPLLHKAFAFYMKHR